MDNIHNATEGLGAEMVVDITGNPNGISQALKLVRPQGTIICKNTCGLPATGIDMTQLVVDKIRLQGSRCGPFELAIKIIRTHQQKLKSLISSTRPLEEIQAALEAAAKEDKVILNMRTD